MAKAKAASAKFYGTGRRKSSIARVYIMPGKGDITINKRSIDEYFGLETLKLIVRQPLVATENADKYDVLVKVQQVRPVLSVTALQEHFARLTQTSVRYSRRTAS